MPIWPDFYSKTKQIRQIRKIGLGKHLFVVIVGMRIYCIYKRYVQSVIRVEYIKY